MSEPPNDCFHDFFLIKSYTSLSFELVIVCRPCTGTLQRGKFQLWLLCGNRMVAGPQMQWKRSVSQKVCRVCLLLMDKKK